MKYGQLPGINKPISRLVQGTVMCSPEKQDYVNAIYWTPCMRRVSIHLTPPMAMARARLSGVSGPGINSRGIREDVVILGKGCHHNQDRRRVTPHDISSDIADSLARFKTDYIDLYVLAP